ncbi:MAG: hypothetical protein QM778_18355 [Myxococcales bacterium]
MPRINPELEALRKFALVIARHRKARGVPLVDEYFIPAVMQCKQVAGMRMVVRDSVEMLQDLKGPELAALDTELTAAGAPTLTSLRSSDERKVLKILLGKRIRNEAEYELIQARLNDTAYEGWTAEQRALADELSWRFLDGK